MCLVCKIKPQECLVSTLRKHEAPSSDTISSQKAGYNIPASPAEGMFSKFTVPQTKNGNLLLEEIFALFAGEYEGPFICTLIASQL